MTQQEKDILIEKMIDAPASLTDAELNVIVNDEELRDIHEASAAMHGACFRQPEIDMEREWRTFRHRLRPKPSPWQWTMRVAAVFLGIMVAAGIVRFAVNRILTEGKPSVTAEATAPITDGVPDIDRRPDPVTPVETVKAETASMAQARPKRVKPMASAPVYIEEEQEEEDDIDIDEYLRLQQARIEHEVAMMQAELYINERQALESPLTPDGTEKPAECEVRYIIMQ